jgi:Na+/melibiose symporter-like transporter
MWLSLIYLGFTIVDLPYRAWGAELSRDYHERTRISAWREGFGMVSGILTLLLLFALPKFGYAGTGATLKVLAVIAIVAMPLLFAITMARVPEPEPEQFRGDRVSLFAGLKTVVRNRPFLTICAATLFLMAGAVIGASLHLIVIAHVFKAAQMFPQIILAESLATIAAVPLWTRLAGKIGKHRAMAAAVLWLAVWSAPIPLLGSDDVYIFFAVITIRGISLGALAVLLPAMLADTVDLDKSQTGEERTGLFFAVSGMVAKLAVALGVLIGTGLPPIFGFETANPANSSDSLFALSVVYAWVPMVIMACAAPFFWRYSLTREAQIALRQTIEQRIDQAKPVR